MEGASQPPIPNLSATSHRALSLIEDWLQNVHDQIQLGKLGEPVVKLRRIEGYEATLGHDTNSTQYKVKAHEVKYGWPGKTSDEAWRFACAVAIFNAIHAALSSATVVTKRDIFYSDPDLFRDQSVVDRFIDDIAHTCQVPRTALMVSASPKGLFACLGVGDGHHHSITTSPPPMNNVNWILVVEKEATFNTLLEDNFHALHQAGPGLIATAKGSPDLATRHFLRVSLDAVVGPVPTFGLFDFDVYGVDILKCYRVGSKAAADDLSANLPELKWLGVRYEDVQRHGNSGSTMSLSPADRKRAIKLMENMTMDGKAALEELSDCRDELQRMLMLNRKAEIQLLGDDLCEWAKAKMLAVMSG